MRKRQTVNLKAMYADKQRTIATEHPAVVTFSLTATIVIAADTINAQLYKWSKLSWCRS